MISKRKYSSIALQDISPQFERSSRRADNRRARRFYEEVIAGPRTAARYQGEEHLWAGKDQNISLTGSFLGVR